MCVCTCAKDTDGVNQMFYVPFVQTIGNGLFWHWSITFISSGTGVWPEHSKQETDLAKCHRSLPHLYSMLDKGGYKRESAFTLWEG